MTSSFCVFRDEKTWGKKEALIFFLQVAISVKKKHHLISSAKNAKKSGSKEKTQFIACKQSSLAPRARITDCGM